MVDHDVAWTGVERHHLAAIGVSELAVRDSADIQSQYWGRAGQNWS
jgi:hypothetical protein